MDTNIILKYNELRNNGTIVPGIQYIEKILPIKTKEDKNFCYLFLTDKNKHTLLCRNLYTDKHINNIIESSNFIIFFHTQNDLENIVTFALLKFSNKKRGENS